MLCPLRVTIRSLCHLTECGFLQLRDLVPSANPAAAVNDDAKRPKHVVLSDTIALVKNLVGKVSTVRFLEALSTDWRGGGWQSALF